MRILHVIDKLNIGGAERVAVNLSNILSENGEDVAFLSLLEKGTLSSSLNPAIKQYELHRKRRFSIKCILQFIRIAKQYDIVHVHTKHNIRYVSFLVMCYPSLRKKIVFHDHSMPEGGFLGIMNCLLIRIAVDSYIGVYQELLEWATKRKIKKAYLLSNIVRKQDVVCTTDETKHDFVSVGNIRPAKNYEFLAKLAKQIQDKSFTIYGNADDINYLNEIKHIISQNVNIVEGVSNVQPLLHNYKLAIHCAASETGPLVLLEYMAQGIPFVTYRTGEVVNQIQNDLPELIVDNFDPETWIKQIQSIEKDYNNIKYRLLRVYDELYSEQRYFGTCMKIYKNVQNC